MQGGAGMVTAKADLAGLAAARALAERTVAASARAMRLVAAVNLVTIPVAAGALVPFGGPLLPLAVAAAAPLAAAGLVILAARLA
jgi:Cu+-exporting ATPase